MLQSLHVKNLALIDETEVTFGGGLNILTGETGAGKSIIIGSINLALGAKADRDMIRSGAEYALVELVFTVEDPAQIKAIQDMDLPLEDGQLILQRKIMENRSQCKVCGETVTAKQLRQLSEILIDIHGQHEHQSLLKETKQLEILDAYAGSGLTEKRSGSGRFSGSTGINAGNCPRTRQTRRRGKKSVPWRSLNAGRSGRRRPFPVRTWKWSARTSV